MAPNVAWNSSAGPFARAAGEPWTEGLVAKTSTLDTQRYWNPEDRARFAADYAFIQATLPPGSLGRVDRPT